MAGSGWRVMVISRRRIPADTEPIMPDRWYWFPFRAGVLLAHSQARASMDKVICAYQGRQSRA